MEQGQWLPTERGTPQGGSVSPLLANIALHGLEEHLQASFPNRASKPIVVRYADDFVVMHGDLTVIERCRSLADEWLAGMGLELKPSKTRISHTLLEHQGHVGFDFLGFTVRQFRVGKYRSGRNTHGQSLGFKTLIKPSKPAQKRHLATMGEEIRRHRATSQDSLIPILNSKIRGWSNYYAGVVSKRVFAKMDAGVHRQLMRWAKRRHPNKGAKWVVRRYWHPRRNRRWSFEGGRNVLVDHADTAIRRHIKVQGTRSPYGGDVAYWGNRIGRHLELSRTQLRLFRDQQGRCTACGWYFLDVNEVLVHDLAGSRSPQGQQNWWQMRRLVHEHCHTR